MEASIPSSELEYFEQIPDEILFRLMCAMDVTTLNRFATTHKRAAEILADPQFRSQCLYPKFQKILGNIESTVVQTPDLLSVNVSGVTYDGIAYDIKLKMMKQELNVVTGKVYLIDKNVDVERKIELMRAALQYALLIWLDNFSEIISQLGEIIYIVEIFTESLPGVFTFETPMTLEGKSAFDIIQEYNSEVPQILTMSVPVQTVPGGFTFPTSYFG